ncbi:urea carboxylase [Granulosicoccus sp. 3-233]|uniref:urea carboxylase n=1 Tax=Granulosicoccus sp. 3-233 TaxID=3417969 RepID=UPI003D33EFB5
MKPFNKVLIANRGAIATRIIRTLERLGIESVAVYADSDRDSLHVRLATEAYSLGDGRASDTYLNVDKLIAIAQRSGAAAIHPGYGFLSENADFVQRCESESLVFIGPTAEQIGLFGQKHVARELATAAGVPLPPGSGLLESVEEALTEACRIGYPVMLKSTAGGGGIGMRLCADEQVLREGFAAVQQQGENHFANGGVFLEKAILNARHVEVQMFGDGKGEVVSLGERDCSAQRRNQKVVEECPAPHLDEALRQRLHRTAEALLASVQYRNAATVEFILDADTQEFHFLEVNTRLQVEHGVTELVYGVDLVEWMVGQAGGTLPALSELRARLSPGGHAVQVRLYAEDPYRQFQPCAGLMSRVEFPQMEGLRVDTWIESGITIPSEFDPMLAKMMVHAPTREQALQTLSTALQAVELYGTQTNVDYLRSLVEEPVVQSGRVTTRFLDEHVYQPHRIDVLRGGTLTTIQDVPGRVGYWPVGIPPSGPFDTLSFQLANRLLGNEAEAAGLEITVQGPALEFTAHTRIVLAGAPVDATLDGEALSPWQVVSIRPGQVLDVGQINGVGARSYLCVAGGIDCPEYLGSRSTFTLGQFGGHNGAALKTGDVLRLKAEASRLSSAAGASQTRLPAELLPALTDDWELRVVYGPHGAPDFFTECDIDTLFEHAWEVHYNSSRTGVRLIGPSPEWARSDGGEAGLHPSNIHDNAYAFGSLDFTGDMPVILGPDGPSLGGFVCPATIITADLWKIGQLRAGNRVRFRPVSVAEAVEADRLQQLTVANLRMSPPGDDSPWPDAASCRRQSAIVKQRKAGTNGVEACYRLAGDRFLLVEYGAPTLDLVSRFRVHALMQWLEQNPLTGIIEVTPGIRSLQLHYDAQQLALSVLLDHLQGAEDYLDQHVDSAVVPSRIVHLPLSWDDEACREAVVKYDQSVRKNAPWAPSNLEFIRRINGLESIDDVKRIVFDASYLVMGLGDVYLGAPVATPVNPAHRLVTTKYNPARTWTAENSVGIGGSYLCVYGMEGPGGYQFIGRTLQMWNRYRQTPEFDKPWLLRFFDQIRFHEVSHDELMEIRRDFPQGRYPLKIEQTEFSLADFRELVEGQQARIDDFQQTRQAAFAEELANWRATGQFNVKVEEPEIPEVVVDWPADSLVMESPVSGSLWQCCVAPGESVKQGQTLLVLESMKMEITVPAPQDLQVHSVLLETGQRVSAGQPLIVLEHS